MDKQFTTSQKYPDNTERDYTTSQKCPDHINDENIDWNDIPECEKVTSEDIEAIEAKSAGMIDGMSRNIDRGILDAIAKKDPNLLSKLREQYEIPPLAPKDARVDVADFLAKNEEYNMERVRKNLAAATYEAVKIIGIIETERCFNQAIDFVQTNTHARN